MHGSTLYVQHPDALAVVVRLTYGGEVLSWVAECHVPPAQRDTVLARFLGELGEQRDTQPAVAHAAGGGAAAGAGAAQPPPPQVDRARLIQVEHEIGALELTVASLREHVLERLRALRLITDAAVANIAATPSNASPSVWRTPQ